MTTSMHAPLRAIGRQLRAEYLPAVGKPLPRELEEVLAQLVALRAGTRESADSVEVVQCTVAQPGRRS